MATKPEDRKRRLSRKEISDLKDAFAVFDKDESGSIDAGELGNVMKMLGRNLTKKELKNMIKKLDVDGNGTVDFPEFVQYVCSHDGPQQSEEEELREAFRVFDKNGDGCITVHELKHVLKKMDSNLTDEQVKEMLEDVDSNGDGVIDYEEFAKLASVQDSEGSEEDEPKKGT